MKASSLILIIFISAISASIGLAQKSGATKALPREQTEFGAEGDFDRPTSVPDEIVQTIRRIDNAPPDQLPADWLAASEIHLDGPDEVDLVVKGIRGLALPHAALFWIFRKQQEGYELVLATGGDSLTVRESRWKGFREISTTNFTQAGRQTTRTIYRFDGQRYKEFNKKLETR
jgi:hypothetical protein